MILVLGLKYCRIIYCLDTVMLEKLLTQETYSLLAEWSLSFVKNAILAIVVYFVG